MAQARGRRAARAGRRRSALTRSRSSSSGCRSRRASQLDVPADGAKVVVVKFNDYQCPACRQTYLAYKGLKEKWESSVERPGAVRLGGLSARERVQHRRHSRRGLRGGGRRAHGAREEPRRGDGRVAVRQPAATDA